MPFFRKIVFSRMFDIGLSFALVFMGLAYFAFDRYWMTAANALIDKTGLAEPTQVVINHIQNLPLISDVIALNPQNMLYLSLAFTIIGFIGLFFMCRTRAELMRTVGKTLYMPAIIGLLAFFGLQLLIQQVVLDEVYLRLFLDPNIYFNPQFIISICIFVTGVMLNAMGKAVQKKQELKREIREELREKSKARAEQKE